MKQHFDNVNGVLALVYVGVAALSQWTINEWAAAAALVYSLLLIVGKLLEWWRKWRGKNNG